MSFLVRCYFEQQREGWRMGRYIRDLLGGVVFTESTNASSQPLSALGLALTSAARLHNT